MFRSAHQRKIGERNSVIAKLHLITHEPVMGGSVVEHINGTDPQLELF